MSYLSTCLTILLINLDSATERLAKMTERLRAKSIDFTRIQAISKDNIKYTEKEYDDKLFRKRFGKEVAITEICCYLSHKKAIDTFLASDKQYALILEDDMLFDDDCFKVIEELIELDFDWDFVKLNASRDGKGLSGWTVKTLSNGRRLCASMFPKLKSGAYLINRRAAESLSKGLLPMSVPFDHEMIKFYKYAIRQYSVFPSPAQEDRIGASTIDCYGDKAKKFPFYKRISVFFYRYFDVQLKRAFYFRNLLGEKRREK